MAGRYTAYSEYKDSGVQWAQSVPAAWVLKRFKSVFKIRKRIAGKLGYKILSITQRGIKIKDTISGDGQLSMDYSKYQLVYAGDFAMNHMDLLTGYVDVSKELGVTSPDYRVFTLEDVNSDSRFCLYLIQLCYIAKIFYPLGRGAAQVGRWRLPADAFNEFLAPFPSLPEQKQIAKFLDHETGRIDLLIEKQQALIALLKEKRQAVISHAVTKGLNPNVKVKDSGVEWLGEVPEHWEVKPLKYSGDIISGFAFKSDSFTPQGVRVLKIANIQTASLDWSDESFVPESYYNNHRDFAVMNGDIVFALTRPIISTGLKAAIARIGDELVLLNQRNAIFRPTDSLEKTFLFHVLFSDSFRIDFENKIDFTGQQPNISPIDIANISIPLPPLEEQILIGEYLDVVVERFSSLEADAKLAINLLQERRTALISAAVTGKIDVRDWEPAPEAQSGE